MIHLDPADRTMIKTYREGLARHLQTHVRCYDCLAYLSMQANLQDAIKVAVARMFDAIEATVE